MRMISRRAFLVTGASAAALCLGACSSSSGQTTSGSSASASASTAGKHIIGVAVYSSTDSEVVMFRHYLVEYIAGVSFEDVQFIYSEELSSEDDILGFIDDIAALGGKGIMSFFNIDLQAEVERCAKHGMYHIVASGTVSDEDFAKVADNKYFIGAIGPGLEMEYNTGTKMVQHFVGDKAGNRYFVMTGGAPLGNEMHNQRVFGMLDALETAYGVDLGDTQKLASTKAATTLTVGDLTVTLSPGYVEIDAMKQQVVESFGTGAYDIVLSVLPVTPVLAMLTAAHLKIAQVDCYSQDNQLLFVSGKLSYLAGKYGSLVGPSFAAMYNAITGHAAEFRDNGKAFKIVQNFWESSSAEDFNEKYALASNVMTPAYNFEDLYSVCRERNASATLDDLRKLASACSFEDAKERRGMV